MRQVIALGGGGFSMEPDNPALDEYILQQARKPHPKVCFLPSASGDSMNYIARFYMAFTRLDCQPAHLSLFYLPTDELDVFLLDHDVIYVGGGNTRSMLALWREWGLIPILDKALDEGIVLAGISAGAICWFEQGITDAVPGRLSILLGLGFLPGTLVPHYDGEPERRPAFHRFIEQDEILPGYGVDDGAAVHFIDERLERVVSSRPGATAYRVERNWENVSEQALERIDLRNQPTGQALSQPSTA